MQPLASQSQHNIPIATSLISAGPATEFLEDYALLDVNLLITSGREGFVAFEVTGDSNAPCIQPGSIIFVDTWAEPHNGQFIAAMIDGRICVKKFKSSPYQGLYLISANMKYKPREVTAKDSFTVLGVVKGNLSIF